MSAAHGRGIDPLLEAIAAAVGARRPDLGGPAGDGEDGGGDDHWDILATDPEAPDEASDGANDEADDEATDADRGDDAPASHRRGGVAGRALRVAFVGRPNAGKSSLTNRLLGEERSLVHHVAGTTTDPVDSAFSIGGRDYVLVDTAGIRRKAKIDADVEKLVGHDGARRRSSAATWSCW